MLELDSRIRKRRDSSIPDRILQGNVYLLIPSYSCTHQDFFSKKLSSEERVCASRTWRSIQVGQNHPFFFPTNPDPDMFPTQKDRGLVAKMISALSGLPSLYNGSQVGISTVSRIHNSALHDLISGLGHQLLCSLAYSKFLFLSELQFTSFPSLFHGVRRILPAGQLRKKRQSHRGTPRRYASQL